MPRPLVLCFLLPGFFAPPPSAASAPVDLGEFQAQAAEILEANRIPGAGIALIQQGEVLWAGGIGRADLEANRPVLGTTRFRIGSITKMFTALAVLRLVDEGRLSLDDPVQELAPELPITNPWHETDPVRVAHLLEHTAGFDDMHFRNMNTDAALPASLRDVVMNLEHELQVRWRPGVAHSYSNPGYAVAGYLVEKVSGVPFHRYVRDNVLLPLGLERVVWGKPADEAFATGYNGRRAIEPRGIRLYPAGELSASSNDLARLVRFFLQRGALDEVRLLPEALIARMETPRTTRAARHGLETGYGLGNYTSVRQCFLLHGHNGGLDGFITELGYSPEHGFGYVVLLNRADAGALRALGELATAFLASAQDAVAPEPGQFDRNITAPGAMAGCYRMSNPRNQLLYGLEWLVQVTCATPEDDRVLLRHPVIPQLTVFAPVSGVLLREQGIPWPNAAYLSDDGLADAFEWSGIYFERSNRVLVTLPLVLAIAALLLMLSAFAFFPVWAVRALRGKLRAAPAIATRVWPLLASSLFVFTVIWSTGLELSLLDTANRITAGIFLGGIAFASASFIALWQVIRSWKAGIHPWVRWHSLLVAAACTLVALYLIYWRLVPLRVWAW